MTMIKLPFMVGNGNSGRRIPELDGAFHQSRRGSLKDTIAETIGTIGSTNDTNRTPELDGAMHIKCTDPIAGMDHMSTTILTKSLAPSDRYELKKFEDRYKEYVSAVDHDGAANRIDGLYHDQVVHMMDGVPMNKSSLYNFHVSLLNDGTKQSVEKFRVIDETHVESVIHSKIHSKNRQWDFCVRALITLKDGKIIRVEKYESAPSMSTPTPQKKSPGAMAA